MRSFKGFFRGYTNEHFVPTLEAMQKIIAFLLR